MFREIIPTIWCDYKVIDKVQEDSSGTTYKVSKSEGAKQIFKIVRVISIPHNAEEINILRNSGKNDFEIKEFYETIARNTVNALGNNISAGNNGNIASARDVKTIPRPDFGFDIFVLEDLLKPLTLHCTTTTLKEKDIAMLGADICSALTECHKNGIFHGSISPETIFLSPSKKYKLGNIGVAQREYFSSISSVFASPELLSQGICDEKSDIYSLGLVLYTLLGGQMPYSVDTPYEEIVNQKSSSKGLPVLQCSNAKLASIVSRSIATNPATRFNSADEFRTALLSVVDGYTSAKAETNDGIYPIYINGKAVYKGDVASPKVTAKHDISRRTSPNFVPEADNYPDSTPQTDNSPVFTPETDNSNLMPPSQEENNKAKSSKTGIIIGVIVALAIIVALIIVIFAIKGNGNNSSEAPSGEISDTSTDSQTSTVSEETSETASSEETSENASSEETSETASSEETSETVSSEEASETVSSEETSETASSEEASETVSSEETSETVSSEETSETVSSEETSETVSSEEASENASSEETSETASSEEASENT